MQGRGLRGWFPTEVQALDGLAVDMWLYSNRVSGFVPTQIGALTALASGLRLSANRFSGALPSELGRLTSLYALNVGGNAFSGTVPTTFARLSPAQCFIEAARLDERRNDDTVVAIGIVQNRSGGKTRRMRIRIRIYRGGETR